MLYVLKPEWNPGETIFIALYGLKGIKPKQTLSSQLATAKSSIPIHTIVVDFYASDGSFIHCGILYIWGSNIDVSSVLIGYLCILIALPVQLNPIIILN